jgi:hypothetical protein
MDLIPGVHSLKYTFSIFWMALWRRATVHQAVGWIGNGWDKDIMLAVKLDAPEHEHLLADARVLGCTCLERRGCRGG